MTIYLSESIMVNFSPYTSHTLDELSQTGVYAIVNKTNGKCYIGSAAASHKNPWKSGFCARWKAHVSLLNNGKHHCIHLQKAWDKYGADEFEFKVVDFLSEKFVHSKEQEYLDLYWDSQHTVLYNSSPVVGNSMKGLKHRKESIEKMRKSKKGQGLGRKHTEESIEKMRKSKKGQKPSKECIRKSVEARVGKPLSIKQKEILSLTNKNNKYAAKYHKIKSPDGELFETYDLKEFASNNNLEYSCIARVSSGKRKSHKGWTKAA